MKTSSRVPELAACALLLLLGVRAEAGDFAARFEEIKRTASAAELYALLYDLPKGGDLHNHSGGANSPELWYKEATNPKVAKSRVYARTKLLNCPDSTEPLIYDLTITQAQYDALSPARKKEYEPLDALSAPDKEKFLSDIWLDKPGEGRDEFFERIFPRFAGMAADPYVDAELMVDNMKLFAGEKVRYVETQSIVFGAGGSPFRRPDGSVMPLDDAIDIFRRRMAQPDAVAIGVTVRFQAIVLRFTPGAIQGVRDAYACMDRNRDLFVGINMAGREDNERGYPSQFTDVYREMRQRYSGFGISIHAGESDEPNFHIRDTLYLGARRIGHGVNLHSDPATMLAMRADGDLVEINLISNKLLEYTPDLDKHPFPDYLRFGIPVCLNTDDRGIYGSDLTDEYYTAMKHYNLSWDEVVLLGRNSLAYSFADPETKRRMLDGYNRAVAAFEAKYGGSGWKKVAAEVTPVVTPYAKREFALGK